jgi:hypothetical protein
LCEVACQAGVCKLWLELIELLWLPRPDYAAVYAGLRLRSSRLHNHDCAAPCSPPGRAAHIIIRAAVFIQVDESSSIGWQPVLLLQMVLLCCLLPLLLLLLLLLMLLMLMLVVANWILGTIPCHT